jgi:hypothetical protein
MIFCIAAARGLRAERWCRFCRSSKNNTEPLNIYILTINYEDTVAFTKKSAKFLDKLVMK